MEQQSAQLSSEQLLRCMPMLQPSAAAAFLPHLLAALHEFGVQPGLELAMYLAQAGHESMDLRRWQEDMNYTAERIQQVFGLRRFPTLEVARPFAHAPEKLANHVYAGVAGNGTEASGDGWRFRGRGPAGLTGRWNYRSAGTRLALPLEEHPEQVERPEVGFRALGWFWASKGCAGPARRGDVEATTKLINGGLNGIEDRKARFERACSVLGVRGGA